MATVASLPERSTRQVYGGHGPVTWAVPCSHLDNIWPLVHLLVVVLLGEQLDDGLGKLHLLVLLLSQGCPHNGEHQHPQVVGHLGVGMGNLP